MHKLIESVNKHTQRIENAYRYIWANPETGYKEWKTHNFLVKEFRELGYELKEAGNIPGFYTDFDTGVPGPMITVMGELDALICKGHPEADPETNAVHCCGHCVSMVFPAVHPTVGGAVGTSHGSDYFITDVETACVDSARVQAAMLVKLLENGGERTWEIKRNFVPTFPSLEAFFRCIDAIDMDREAVRYNADGTVTLAFEKENSL